MQKTRKWGDEIIDVYSESEKEIDPFGEKCFNIVFMPLHIVFHSSPKPN